MINYVAEVVEQELNVSMCCMLRSLFIVTKFIVFRVLYRNMYVEYCRCVNTFTAQFSTLSEVW